MSKVPHLIVRYYTMQNFRTFCTAIFNGVVVKLVYPSLVFSFQDFQNEVSQEGGSVLFENKNCTPLPF